MTEDFKALIDARRNGTAATTAEPEEDSPEPDVEMPGKCYSLVSSDRQRKLMLEFRFRTSDSTALAYTYLLGVYFNPSKGITLDFGGKSVQVTGRNLRPLYDAIVAQRVAWIREVESRHAEITAEDGAGVIKGIVVQDA
jgi:opacity protein-like surface antigen